MTDSRAVLRLLVDHFRGGLNKEAKEPAVQLNEMVSALNVDLDDAGHLLRRTGWSTDVFSTTNIAAIGIDHLFNRSGATLDFVYMVTDNDEDGSVFYWRVGLNPTDNAIGHDMGDWTDTKDGYDYHVPSAQMGGAIYLTTLRLDTLQGGTGDGPLKFVDATPTAVAASDFNGVASRFPRAATLETVHDRMWAGNVQDSTIPTPNKWPSRLHYSVANTPETWNANDYIDVDPDDDQAITRLIAFGEVLIIFKDHKLFVLGGRSELSFNLFKVDNRLGTTAPKTVHSVGNEVLFFDPDHGVYGFDGASFDFKSAKINTYLLNGINYSRRYMANAWVRRNKYFLSVPWGTNEYCSRTFVLNLNNGAWVEWDTGFNSVVKRLDVQNFWLCSRGKGADAVHSIHTTVDESKTGRDNGAVITASVETAFLRLDPSTWSKRYRFRALNLMTDSISDIYNLYVSIDDGTYSAVIAANQNEFGRYTENINGKIGQWIQAKIENQSNGEFELMGVEVEGTERGPQVREGLT